MINENDIANTLEQVAQVAKDLIPTNRFERPKVDAVQMDRLITATTSEAKDGRTFAWWEGMRVGAQGWESNQFHWADAFTGEARTDWYKGARFGLSCVPVAIRRRRTIIARTNRANGTWRK
jgi:hypothetical protein